MFLPAPNACGSLLITAQALDNVMTVDSGLYQTLEDILGILGEDHTYLKIGTAPYIEYIRVTGVSNIPNQIIVDRGIDGTNPQVHAANTRMEYVMAYAAVQDAISAAEQLSVTLDGIGNIDIEELGPNHFSIKVLGYTIVSENQSIYAWQAGVDDDTNSILIDLSVNPEMIGECRNPHGGEY